MSETRWFRKISMGLGALTTLLALALPVGAVTLEQTPEGYIARLASGESVVDGWWAIWSERRSVHPPVGVLDIIELGPGAFSLTDSLGNRLLHYRSSHSDPFLPPLLVRGAGALETSIRCTVHRLDDACAVSLVGLTFEDLSFLSDHGHRAPIVRVSNADLTLRRFRLVGQNVWVPEHRGAIGVFNGNLTIEDSVLSGNQISGGDGLIQFGDNRPAFTARIVRSVLAGNHAPALIALSSYYGSRLEIVQSTLAENAGGALLAGFYGESVSVSRSILSGGPNPVVQLNVEDSFTGAEPRLVDDGLGLFVPRPASPVVDRLPCEEPGLDLRGEPTGVAASYLLPGTTPCDFGAVEARHSFCQATDRGTVACEDGEIDRAEVAELGCRLLGGLLDCTGGEETIVTSLASGESVVAGDAELLLQTDGNLVLYDEGVALWAMGTQQSSCIGRYAELRADGRFVVVSDPQAAGGARVCFDAGVVGERVVLREGFRGQPAQLLIEQAEGVVTWITGYPVAAESSFASLGARFRPGDALTLSGAAARMEPTGEFVLYDTIDGVETPLWSLGGGAECSGTEARFRADGRLVVGEEGSGCLASSQPPAGGTVLRLERTPLGGASLALYDAVGEVLWRVPRSLTSEAHCGDFPAGSPNGVYAVTDRTGTERQVYCDMSGGGWMLVGKVFRSHTGTSNLPEPADWWVTGTGQVEALVPGTVDWVGGSGYAAYGARWLADLDLAVARFDVIAEHADPFGDIGDATSGQTGTWYKDASTIATWFSPADTSATPVCDTEELTCEQEGRIMETNDGTFLEGMVLPVGSGPIHLRPDIDSRPEFDGVCSFTFNRPEWADSAAEHWGNGLDVWVKAAAREPTRCTDLPAGSPDGIYTVVDPAGAERQVFCDMSGGGWMLVGKVFRSHTGTSNLPEPADWWVTGTGQVEALVPGTVDWVGGSGYAAYGARWLADLDLAVARFDVIAEHADPFGDIGDATSGQTGTWYKDASTIATWFSPDDTSATPVCDTEELSCGQVGRILETNDATLLEGMVLPAGSGPIHLRPDSDSRPEFDGVCSFTFNQPSWLDSAAEHWGNGLDVWVK